MQRVHAWMLEAIVGVFAVGAVITPIFAQPTSAPPTPYKVDAVYRLGETVSINPWLTLTIRRGSQATVGLLSPRFSTPESSVVLELAFDLATEDQPGMWFYLSDDEHKSDVVIQAGQKRFAPTRLAFVAGAAPPRALSLRDLPLAKNGKRYAMIMPFKGPLIHALRFATPADQLGQDPILLVAFEIVTGAGTERYSLAVRLT
jgi:hypothetical protein